MHFSGSGKSYTMMGTLEEKEIIPQLCDALFKRYFRFTRFGPQIRQSPNRPELMFFSGSGKSYTMMGTLEEKGIIPRLCDALFEGIQRLGDESTSFKVEVSYMEIYNEKVHDLLDPKG